MSFEVPGALSTVLEKPKERLIHTPGRTHNRIRSPRLEASSRFRSAGFENTTSHARNGLRRTHSEQKLAKHLADLTRNAVDSPLRLIDMSLHQHANHAIQKWVQLLHVLPSEDESL